MKKNTKTHAWYISGLQSELPIFIAESTASFFQKCPLHQPESPLIQIASHPTTATTTNWNSWTPPDTTGRRHHIRHHQPPFISLSTTLTLILTSLMINGLTKLIFSTIRNTIHRSRSILILIVRRRLLNLLSIWILMSM